MADIIYPELSYTINGLCFKVHNELGKTRSEKSYADALEVKFKEAELKYVREHPLAPSFEGEQERRNVPDFVIEGIIILDTKAKRACSREDYYQMKRYLSVANLRLGILVNFQEEHLHPKRVLG
ncbi:MAG: GxxExxY protein [bacterium]|nr:GxxExxY protein [bacterium]